MIWGLMVPSLSQKVANFYYLGQCLSQKVGFFLIFEPILRAGFFDKMLALSNKKSTIVLVSGFLCCCIFTILFNIIRKFAFELKRHLKLP